MCIEPCRIRYMDRTGVYVEDGNCTICGLPTIRIGSNEVDKARDEAGAGKEPFVCNSCIIEINSKLEDSEYLAGLVADELEREMRRGF
jgi:hypothetical protein